MLPDWWFGDFWPLCGGVSYLWLMRVDCDALVV